MSTKCLRKNLRNKYTILHSAKYFSSGVFQNDLIFIFKYSKFISGITEIYSVKSNGMSDKSIENIATSNNTFNLTLINSFP